MLRIAALCHSVVSQAMSKSGPWFYAVRKGRVPGVYSSWAECEQQVKGFPNPTYKKFPSHDAAKEFVAGNSANSFSSSGSNGVFSHSSSPPHAKSSQFNAGSVSTPSSVSNEDIQATLQRMMGAVERLTSGLEEVRSRVSKLEDNFFIAPGSKRNFSTSATTTNEVDKVKKQKFDYEREHFTGKRFDDSEGTHVYTDGGCFDNGRCGARAGIGVYWKDNDSDNVSDRLPGRPTNNRAEIHAAVRAVQQAKKKGIQNLILHTDSQFLINSITKWIKGWKKNQWTKTTGSPVINREDFEELDKELKGINVKWVYVRGHTGHPANEAADRLAKQGAEKDL